VALGSIGASVSERAQILKLESALQTAAPFESLLALAQQMKEQGVTQKDMYELFAAQRLRYMDTNESYADVIADVLDRIVGWCQPAHRLFESELKT